MVGLLKAAVAVAAVVLKHAELVRLGLVMDVYYQGGIFVVQPTYSYWQLLGPCPLQGHLSLCS